LAGDGVEGVNGAGIRIIRDQQGVAQLRMLVPGLWRVVNGMLSVCIILVGRAEVGVSAALTKARVLRR
jgi:hypothetical protein